MQCITLKSDDPFFNLAVEELLLKQSEEEYLLLYINNPSVIIGKHQSPHIEANSEFVFKNDIPVIRRISGGGTVFHDYGNLNFSFIRQSEPGKQVDFRKYTQPVIDFLQSLGVDARFEGKNDIKTGGLKISGNAEHVHRERVLHHGTLLFNASLDLLRNTLREERSAYSSRAVESNPSRVMNLIERLGTFRDAYELRSEMMSYFLGNFKSYSIYELSEAETEEAKLLAKTKYKTWEWNYGYGPDYVFNKAFMLNGRNHSCKLDVREGVIVECIIEGSDLMKDASKKLTGCRHMVPDLRKVIKSENIDMSVEDIFKFF